MEKIKDIADKTMTSEKRAVAYNDFFAFYIGRPLSYIITVPFLKLDVKPKTVSIISMLFPLIGFLLFLVGYTKVLFFWGWVMFFVWNLLDGVDGNIARYTGRTSKLGSVYDAMGGYIAMVLTFFSAGIGAINVHPVVTRLLNVKPEYFIIMGAFSGISMLFPRLIMHKKISSFMNQSVVNDVKDKSNFGPLKIIALNLASVSGGAQVLLLISIFLNILDLYTVCYFIFNLLVMVVSLKSILAE